MEKMNALTLIITLVVGVILTGALLGPVINDASQTEKTFENSGYFYMDEIDTTTSRTIVVDSADLSTILVDDVAVPNGSTGIGATIVCSDDWLIRTTSTGAQVFTSSGAGAGTSAGQPIMTITIEGGEVEVTASSTTTLSFTEGFCISKTKGDWVMKAANTPVYMVAGSDIVNSELTAMGRTSAGGNNSIGVRITGTVLDVNISEFTNTSVVFGDPTINATAINGYAGLYSLSNIKFTGTIDDNTSNVTYDRFIVPSSVTAELSQHLTPGQISLIGAIPVMVIVALLMVAIGGIALRRND